jgi:hypothetical protein
MVEVVVVLVGLGGRRWRESRTRWGLGDAHFGGGIGCSAMLTARYSDALDAVSIRVHWRTKAQTRWFGWCFMGCPSGELGLTLESLDYIGSRDIT